MHDHLPPPRNSAFLSSQCPRTASDSPFRLQLGREDWSPAMHCPQGPQHPNRTSIRCFHMLVEGGSTSCHISDSHPCGINSPAISEAQSNSIDRLPRPVDPSLASQHSRICHFGFNLVIVFGFPISWCCIFSAKSSSPQVNQAGHPHLHTTPISQALLGKTTVQGADSP